MKTDKLFYRIFLNQPSLIRELLPEIPEDCQFEYFAPVVKEKEIRLDGLLTPIGDNPHLPPTQVEKVKSLSIPQLESLGEALLDFQSLSDLENWFQNNNIVM